MSDEKYLKGLPLKLDAAALSASDQEPAFIARPAAAPVYHGFLVLDDVVVEGFTLGVITDFEDTATDHGDAFVIAPDGSRAGLVWELSDPPYFQQVRHLETGRWGVWGVGFSAPMRSRSDAARNLAAILPRLREKWEEWKRLYP